MYMYIKHLKECLFRVLLQVIFFSSKFDFSLG